MWLQPTRWQGSPLGFLAQSWFTVGGLGLTGRELGVEAGKLEASHWGTATLRLGGRKPSICVLEKLTYWEAAHDECCRTHWGIGCGISRTHWKATRKPPAGDIAVHVGKLPEPSLELASKLPLKVPLKFFGHEFYW